MTKLATLEATLEAIYPVGSVYATIDDKFNPNVSFRGTWERIKPGHTLWSADSGGGQYLAPGLPNIYGTLAICDGAYFTDRPNGFISKFDNSESTGYEDPGLGGRGQGTAYFDASRCSRIYGNSQTVQPPAIKTNIWIRKS